MSTQDKEFGLAWNSEGYEAEQYIRARAPHPPILIDLVLSYHRHFSSSPQFAAVADIGCGPGQLAIHFSHHFTNTYGVDPSPRSLVLAESLQNLTGEQGAKYGLPTPPPKPITFKEGTASETGLPDQSVDLIVSGASAHWWGLEDPEVRKKTWGEFERILKPGGTVAILAHRGTVGPARGATEEEERIRNAFGLEKLMRDPEIMTFLQKKGVDLRLFAQNPTPSGDSSRVSGGSDLSEASKATTNVQGAGTETRAAGSRAYGLIVLPDDASVWDTSPSSRPFLSVDLPEEHFIERKPDRMPNWAPPAILDYLSSDVSGNTTTPGKRSLVPATTTPKDRAESARSASYYIRFLEDNPEEKALVASDQDWVARKMRKVCEEEGIGYEQEIEQRIGFLVVFFRKKGLEG